jgi:hypothetical protein
MEKVAPKDQGNSIGTFLHCREGPEFWENSIKKINGSSELFESSFGQFKDWFSALFFAFFSLIKH